MPTLSQIRLGKIIWIILICWDIPVHAYVHIRPTAGLLPFAHEDDINRTHMNTVHEHYTVAIFYSSRHNVELFDILIF